MDDIATLTINRLRAAFDVKAPQVESETAADGIVFTRDFNYALLKGGYTQGIAEFGMSQDEADRERESLQCFTGSIETITPAAPVYVPGDQIARLWDLLRDRWNRSDCLAADPQFQFDLSDSAYSILQGVVKFEAAGAEHPYLEKCKRAFVIGACPVGMAGFVPDEWPDGDAIAFWPFEPPYPNEKEYR